MRERLVRIHLAMFYPRPMPRTRIAALLLIAVLLSVLSVPAGSVPAQQRPVFGASVERVRVDVIVTGPGGQFVDDLGFEDFLVYEDGVAQEVLDVQLVDLGVGTVADLQPLVAEGVSPSLTPEGAPPGVPAEGESTRGSAGPGTEPRPTRPVGDAFGATVYLIDGSSLDPGARIRFARQWGEMLDETPRLNVPSAVYMFDNDGVLSELLPLTYDVEALRATADQVERLPTIGTSMQKKLVALLNEASDPATEGNAIVRARMYEAEELARSFASLERLTQFCDALAVRSGRTALVWVSTGVKLTDAGPYWAIGGDDPARLQKRHRGIEKSQKALHEAANSANVSIYSIDPSLPGAMQTVQYDVESAAGGTNFLYEEFNAEVELDWRLQIEGSVDGLRDSLRHAATATGGEAFIQWGESQLALQAIQEDGRRYYLLTYAVPPPLGDDEYHDIRVEVQRSGVEVRARGGYVDLAPMDRRTRSVAAALMVPGTVATTPLGVKAFQMWSAEGDPVVDLAVAVESAEEAEMRARAAAQLEADGSGSRGSDARGSGAGASGSGTSIPWKELHAMALSSDMEIIDEFHIDVERPVGFSSEDGAPATPGDSAALRPFVYVHNWELPPGAQDIRVVLTDAATGQLRAAQLQLEVPEPSGEWTASDLMLTVSEGDRPFQPLIDNEVSPRERLEIYVEVFGGRGPSISGLVFGSNPNHPLAELPPFTLPRAAAGIHRGALWLEGIPPGRYTLKILVADPSKDEEREFEVSLVSRSRSSSRR
jgi:VWFA-related protein